MTIKDWPAAERPRERLLAHGATVLSDAELLAVLLRSGSHGRSALDIARSLLDPGGLRALFEMDETQLCKINGVGQARYAELQACLELNRRYLQAKLVRGDTLANPSHTRRFLSSKLRQYPYEVFACMFLDNRNRMIRYEELFRGTLDSTNVYPRDIVARALALNAAGVILAHNHPSGHTRPSECDRGLTRRLQQALDLVGIRVLDHFIVGDGEALSFAENGWL